MSVIVFAIAIWALYRLVRYIRKRCYFASEGFLNHKENIAAVVAEHNEVGRYTEEIHVAGLFELGASATGAQVHLAAFENTSRYNYRRDRNVATYQAPHVHNCSLQVARNASVNPIKYLMKYFNIKADEPTLGEVEKVGESVVRLEDAVANLHQREASITQSIDPPRFIMKHYANEFMSQVGVELSPITVPYPVYAFEYISAGGNSSQRTVINLDAPTIDAVIETLGQKIRFKRSAAGQRALMTVNLRNFVKTRDNHTCKYCSVSVATEPHLLLEVDHIMPVSKGGLSSLENLQTLCWRCNRSKSDKIFVPAPPDSPVVPDAPEPVRPAPVKAVFDPMGQLEKLGSLRDAGILSEAEFATKKAEILSRF